MNAGTSGRVRNAGPASPTRGAGRLSFRSLSSSASPPLEDATGPAAAAAAAASGAVADAHRRTSSDASALHDGGGGSGGGGDGEASDGPALGAPYDDDVYLDRINRLPRDVVDRRIGRAAKLAARRAARGPERPLKHHRVPVPAEVTLHAAGTRLRFDGPLGSNALDLRGIDQRGMAAYRLERDASGRIDAVCLAGPDKAVVGTARSLLHNKIHGVTRGYLVYLQLAGVGFRVSKSVEPVALRTAAPSAADAVADALRGSGESVTAGSA